MVFMVQLLFANRDFGIMAAERKKEEESKGKNNNYSNEDLVHEELIRYKQMLNETIANMDRIIEDVSTKATDRRKAEKVKTECSEDLQDILAAESKSSDQNRTINEAIEPISRRHSAKKTRYSFVKDIDKLLEDLKKRRKKQGQQR